MARYRIWTWGDIREIWDILIQTCPNHHKIITRWLLGTTPTFKQLSRDIKERQ